MKTVTSVPESITREAYIELIAGLGFETNLLRRLEFRMDGIYAEVMERGPNGGPILDRTRDEVVVNNVWIPVRD